jgi:hypothetical protein
MVREAPCPFGGLDTGAAIGTGGESVEFVQPAFGVTRWQWVSLNKAGVATSRNRAHIPIMADKHRKGQHNPTQKSLQRWDTEGGAAKGVHRKRPRDPLTPEEQGKDSAAVELDRREGPQRRGKARAKKMSAHSER